MQTSLVLTVLLFGGAAATGCGSSATAPTSPQTAPGGGVYGVVGSNHPAPHVAHLSDAQLSAGAGVTLDISNGLHSHALVLTGTQVSLIAAKGKVVVTSSTNPHSNGSEPHDHAVTFN